MVQLIQVVFAHARIETVGVLSDSARLTYDCSLVWVVLGSAAYTSGTSTTLDFLCGEVGGGEIVRHEIGIGVDTVGGLTYGPAGGALGQVLSTIRG